MFGIVKLSAGCFIVYIIGPMSSKAVASCLRPKELGHLLLLLLHSYLNYWSTCLRHDTTIFISFDSFASRTCGNLSREFVSGE